MKPLRNSNRGVIKNSSTTFKNSGTKSLKSLRCSNYETCGCIEMVDINTVQVICHVCVQKLVGIDPSYLQSRTAKKEKSDFPKGWYLYKQYVHSDGRVFEHGKEVPGLKGKLKPTEIKETPTLTKFEKRKRRDEKQLKRDARLAKKYKKIQKLKKKVIENENL